MATIAATPATTAQTLETSSPAPKNKADQQKTQFLELLVAQLKGQNPLDPKDGTEFVSQLAQFSSLEELINIRTDLDSITKTATTTTSTSTAKQSSNPFEGV